MKVALKAMANLMPQDHMIGVWPCDDFALTGGGNPNRTGDRHG